MSGNMKLQALTALLGAVGVAAAAFGAHGLEKIATPEQVSWWTTGVAMTQTTSLAAVWDVQWTDEKSGGQCQVQTSAAIRTSRPLGSDVRERQVARESDACGR